jgi:hypothetical protein
VLAISCFFDVDIVGNALATFDLRLQIGDTDLNEILVNGNPLILTFAPPTLESFLLGHPNGIFQFDEFTNFNLLPPGAPIVFSVSGIFEGRSAGCDHCPYGASVTISGVGQPLPEPATLVMVGVGLTAGVARRRSRRAGLKPSAARIRP